LDIVDKGVHYEISDDMFDAQDVQDEEEGTQGHDVAMLLLKTNRAIHLDAKLQNVLLL
jgi:hypothetical protein